MADIKKRKKDHLKYALSPEAQIGDPGFARYRIQHNALPEMDFKDIDTSTTFLGKKVSLPLFISCMTGGVERGAEINRNLSLAAQKKKIAFGVGSQRAAVEHPELKALFDVRKYAPDVPVMANVGLVQLNYGFGIKELEEIVNMVKADALVFHLNPIQELIQPEGDSNFSDLIPKVKKIVKSLSVPVIVKEVGFGLSEDVMERLYDTGVRIFDTAGWGGTNWAWVEGKRREGFDELGELFSEWGISTTDSIRMAAEMKRKRKAADMVILGSGGVRNGLDIAKAIALGADLVGVATPFAKAALISSSEVVRLIEKLENELNIAMFGSGAKTVVDLQRARVASS